MNIQLQTNNTPIASGWSFYHHQQQNPFSAFSSPGETTAMDWEPTSDKNGSCPTEWDSSPDPMSVCKEEKNITRNSNFVNNPVKGAKEDSHTIISNSTLATLDFDAVLVHRGYEFRKEIAEGGNGVVLKAYSKQHGKDVALKHIRCSNREIIQNEIKTLKLFRGIRGFVQYYEDVQASFGTFIIMELCEGMDLYEYVQAHGPLSLCDVRSLTDRLCQAMKVMHELDVVHMDLKPLNIIYDKTKGPTIIDFGLCKTLPASGKVFGACGTQLYTAPEVRHVGNGADCSADIFSLGCTLYFILTGHNLEYYRTYKNTDPWHLITDQPTVSFLQQLTHEDPTQRPTAHGARFLYDWVDDL